LLDTLLVEAARDADAEVRERVVVDELTFSDERVTGVRGRSHGGGEIIEESRLVVGADGKHSLVARSVKAAT
jgi:flavin-dependent dehydrogenase